MMVKISTPSTIGRISGLGWGAGYLGGIFLLLLVYVGFIGGDSHWFGIIDDDAMNIRVVALFAACWFRRFSSSWWPGSSCCGRFLIPKHPRVNASGYSIP